MTFRPAAALAGRLLAGLLAAPLVANAGVQLAAGDAGPATGGILQPTVQPLVRCSWIYARDVLDTTYQIVSPGRYCLAEDLIATIPDGLAPVAQRRESDSGLEGPRPARILTMGHLDAAIVVLASDVEIDLQGHELTQSVPRAIRDGIRIDPGFSRVRVHNGTISRFTQGVVSEKGSGVGPHADLRFTDLRLVENEYGAALVGTVRSRMQNNVAIAPVFAGLVVSNSEDALVTGNRIELTHPRTVGVYTSWRLKRVRIAANTIRGGGQDGSTGISLHNGGHRKPPSEHGRTNVVENNYIYRIRRPIVLSGSGVAWDNTVRGNRIFGLNEYRRVEKWVPSPKPQSAITISNNENVRVEGNLVLSDVSVSYYSAVKFQHRASVARDRNGKPLLRHNIACGVHVGLIVPSGSSPSLFDGGNDWDACDIAIR